MIGKIIDNLIREHKTSKTKFSAYLVISRSTLDDYLNERTFMPSNLIEKTAAYFCVSIAFLFGETTEVGKYVEESLREQLYELTAITKQMKKLSKTLK